MDGVPRAYRTINSVTRVQDSGRRGNSFNKLSSLSPADVIFIPSLLKFTLKSSSVALSLPVSFVQLCFASRCLYAQGIVALKLWWMKEEVLELKLRRKAAGQELKIYPLQDPSRRERSVRVLTKNTKATLPYRTRDIISPDCQFTSSSLPKACWVEGISRCLPCGYRMRKVSSSLIANLVGGSLHSSLQESNCCA